ncbi:ABATE domain-containing protein [Saccharopolyspora sp. K220]|uniref:CGNR zinc finger domain-containing protein n=1 Tax=Saccharopolyspora soli TaxID=2926618 RepID=UPI001F57E6E2|nr:CGNR zinc finger domain-containing protein [Saccharopolyspora soli]MCI2419528.1 ABATE domain-containing protein [Saccharopolyspora soli]
MPDIAGNPTGRAPVDLLLRFVNTRADAGGRTEQFGDAAGFNAWLAQSGLEAGEPIASAADAASARELRDALVTVMLAHSGDESLPAAAVDAAEQHLRRIAARYPLVPVITVDGAELISEQTGVPGVFGTVLAAVTEFAQRGDWGRVKACRNPPCHFGFFDRTRNASGAFCSSGCRSQASMRAYRQRRKQS